MQVWNMICKTLRVYVSWFSLLMTWKKLLQFYVKRQDMRVVQERDYITHRKASGYRSYHVVVEYTVDTINGAKTILAEIQIRTLAMNFWARLNTRSIINIRAIFQKKSGKTGNHGQNSLSTG